jgi:hemerythrin superfamily protein
MTASKPINRCDQLKPLSREHHHGLLLCWKIKTGFSKGVSPHRIKSYADWFYKQYLVPHFEAEEKYVFPILGNDNELIKKAIEQHRLLSGLLSDSTNIENSLKQIQTELDKHIRFEERTLFNEIQNAATPEQLKLLEQNLSEEKFTENLSDVFWK